MNKPKAKRKRREKRAALSKAKRIEWQNKRFIPLYTQEELDVFARDIYTGQIFTDRHLGNQAHSMTGSVFMILHFIPNETLRGIMRDKPGMFFEYLDKANPLAVNGFPTFFSVRIMNEEQAEYVWEKYRQIKAAMDELVPTSV